MSDRVEITTVVVQRQSTDLKSASLAEDRVSWLWDIVIKASLILNQGHIFYPLSRRPLVATKSFPY